MLCEYVTFKYTSHTLQGLLYSCSFYLAIYNTEFSRNKDSGKEGPVKVPTYILMAVSALL
jgi:hypothetical protein